MTWIDSPQVAVVERMLDLNTSRQSLISTNIANVDTPGYHTRDIDFRGELQRAMDGNYKDSVGPFVMAVKGLNERPDGNNVNIDRESMLLAEIQLQFKTATAILRAKFSQISTAIREGQ
jgi:flagellar basal-body rod protein FlgB